MMSTRSKKTTADFDSLSSALHIFNAGPANPAWDEAVCYLLSEKTPVAIQEQVETTITEVLQAFYSFAFQADTYPETSKSAITTQGLANRFGIDQQQLLGWAQRLESRLGKSILHNPKRATCLEEAVA